MTKLSDQALEALDDLRLPSWYLDLMAVKGSEGDPDPNDEDDTEDDTSDSTDADESDEKKFSQKDMNAVVAKEVAKANRKATRGKLDAKELGFDSAKELKEFIDTMKQKADKEKTDEEKAKEKAIEDAKTSTKTEIMADANARLLKAEFKLKAAELGIKETNDAFVLAASMKDLWDDVEIDDDGEVQGLDDDFFDELKKRKGYLFTSKKDDDDEDDDEGKGRDAGAGAGAGGPTGGKRKKPKEGSAEQLKSDYPALKRILDAGVREKV